MSYKWTCLTENAAFAPRDGAGALVFNDRMWLLGGWNPDDKDHFPQDCNSEVWSSADGLDWRLELRQAPWEGRHTAGYVVYNDRMWVIGGDPNQGHHQSDIWSTPDGLNWTREVEVAPWAPRVLHQTMVFLDKIWVMGGQTLTPFAGDAPDTYYDDVWNSSDGVHWEQVATGVPWAPRGMIGGSVVLHDRLWVLGGGTYSSPKIPVRIYYNDVWSTADGTDWVQNTPSTPWEARQYHDVTVFDGRMWIFGGINIAGNRNDVWHSADGLTWHDMPETPWLPRHAASVFIFHDALWIVAGNNMTSDVWKLEKAG